MCCVSISFFRCIPCLSMASMPCSRWLLYIQIDLHPIRYNDWCIVKHGMQWGTWVGLPNLCITWCAFLAVSYVCLRPTLKYLRINRQMDTLMLILLFRLMLKCTQKGSLSKVCPATPLSSLVIEINGQKTDQPVKIGIQESKSLRIHCNRRMGVILNE